ncbi:MAG: DUF2804 domain-containing protein [Clostridia bacterium]|nr:DUF2804 domain-containing protein [Clostridia bacterium]
MKQHRFGPGPLLNGQGNLCEPGFSTALTKSYDRGAIRASKLRIKEWDYYLITNERYGVALTIDDNGYMGMLSASVIDFANRSETTVSPMFWFPMGKTALPASSKTGDVKKTLKIAEGAFEHTKDGRKLSFRIDRFSDGKPFSCEILLSDEPKDSMVIATPFMKRGHFYYNQKIVGMRAKGSFSIGNETTMFDPETTFGLLDWGRGVWTYKNTWYWSAAQGIVDGHRFGFNLGYGFGDTSAASENMLFFDGTAHKLSRVDFGIPKKNDGSDDLLSPWHFTDDEGRLDLVFTPILDRASDTNAIVIRSDQHQVFGRFTGSAVLDDGSIVPIENLPGFAEKVFNKW